MLEQSLFLIQSWGNDPSRTAILDPRTREALGFIYHRRRRGLFTRLCWWKRFDLDIHENDDEPLLMTLRSSFFPWFSWFVLDADGRLVGRIEAGKLFDEVGEPLALFRKSEGIYRGVKGDLAATNPEEGGIRLTLLGGEQSNPFVKMVLLAGAIVHNQTWLLKGASPRHAIPPVPRSRP